MLPDDLLDFLENDTDQLGLRIQLQMIPDMIKTVFTSTSLHY